MVSEELPSFVSKPASLPMGAARDLRTHADVITQPVAILLIAVWFGLLAGLGEISTAAVAKFFLHRFTHLNPHIAWMTPSADAIIFAIPGLIFLLVIWRWPKTTSLRLAIFVFGFLGSLSVLFRVTWLQDYASVLLAIGFGVQISRLVVAHPKGFYRFVRLSLGGMSAIVVILAMGLYIRQALVARRAVANLPAASAGAPNVLLIVMDTVGAEHLSLYGYARPTTPRLERLARTGVRFERAISTAPWTLPAHASIFTGRYPHELSAEWHSPLDATFPTLAEALSAQGYLTAGFVANTVYCSPESGLNRGFAHYEDFTASVRQVIPSSSIVGKILDYDNVRRVACDEECFGRKTAEHINSEVLNWLDHKDPQRPFFAFLNYFDAHAPYTPPKPFDSKFGSTRPSFNPRIKPSESWPAAEVQAQLDTYDGAIAYLDDQLGLLFDDLQRRGLLENTLVIVTSDHGEEFLEHGVMQHGWSTYLKALHVPLVISFPGHVPSGKSVDELATLRDLSATVIDLLDLNDKTRFPGVSLVRSWNNSRDSVSTAKSPLLSELGLQTTDTPEHYPIRKGKGTLDSLLVGKYHYIRSFEGREELYDFISDPLERNNLTGSGTAQQTLEQLRDSLEAILSRKPSGK